MCLLDGVKIRRIHLQPRGPARGNKRRCGLLPNHFGYLSDKVDCHDVLVPGTRVAISHTARDLGVVTSSTVSCRWQPTSRPSVAPVTTSYASSDQ